MRGWSDPRCVASEHFFQFLQQENIEEPAFSKEHVVFLSEFFISLINLDNSAHRMHTAYAYFSDIASIVSDFFCTPFEKI